MAHRKRDYKWQNWKLDGFIENVLQKVLNSMLPINISLGTEIIQELKSWYF